jgi:hypothetical protein
LEGRAYVSQKISFVPGGKNRHSVHICECSEGKFAYLSYTKIASENCWPERKNESRNSTQFSPVDRPILSQQIIAEI